MTLKHLKILVTRPAEQAEHLCNLIETHGGQPVRLPVINIVNVEDLTPLYQCRDQLHQFDIAIFISTNAVQKSLPILLSAGPLPSHLQLIGVGKRTVEMLTAQGQLALCPPPPFNSEAVLTLSQLQPSAIQNRHVVIFRGEGGREWLATTLQQRGATVHYVNVYRRELPSLPPDWLDKEKMDLIIVTSGEGLQNLFTLLKGQPWLYETPLVLMSQRLVPQAQQLGVRASIFVAPTASDEGLLEATLEAAQGCVR